jgi:hypothetical protein
MPNPLTIKHSGFLGDLVASLPAMRGLSEKYQTTIALYIFIDQQWALMEDATRQNSGLINDADYKFIEPLIEVLPFIDSVNKWGGERIHYDFDKAKYRGGEIGMPHSNLSRLPMYLFPESSTDLSKRTINLDDLEAGQLHREDIVANYGFLNEAILVGRSLRWTNPYINYVFLQSMDKEVFFIGTLPEYELFASHVPKAVRLDVSSALDAAIAIASSKLYIGNQSLFFNIAELIKTPRLLECCREATNVLPQGSNGYDFYTQEGLEYLVHDLTKQTA